MLFIAFVCILLKTHIDIRSKYVKTRKPAESVAYSAFYITFRKPVKVAEVLSTSGSNSSKKTQISADFFYSKFFNSDIIHEI